MSFFTPKGTLRAKGLKGLSLPNFLRVAFVTLKLLFVTIMQMWLLYLTMAPFK